MIHKMISIIFSKILNKGLQVHSKNITLGAEIVTILTNFSYCSINMIGVFNLSQRLSRDIYYTIMINDEQS